MEHKLIPMGVLTIVLLLGSVGLAPAQAPAPRSPAARRAALLREAPQGAAAIPSLTAALRDENLVVRRTAVRLLAEVGPAAREALIGALDNSDGLVRRTALLALCDPPTADSVAPLGKAVKDADPLLRLTAVGLLVQLKPRTQAVQDLLEQARKDESGAVREVAARALWPFFRDSIPLRERKDFDHEIKVAQTFPLPKEGWRFQLDPKEDGHLRKWYEAGFDDSAWDAIKIESAWEEQGHPGYDGVAWYRGSFDLPAKPECIGAEIAFGGVDEVAWVWINGQYVGQHDLCPSGWDKPFTLDVSAELKWGQRNQITVRVYDSTQAGGIWQPVSIQVLR